MSVSITVDDGHVEGRHNLGRMLFSVELNASLPEEEAVDIIQRALEPYAD